jgi:hypothetical protein
MMTSRSGSRQTVHFNTRMTDRFFYPTMAMDTSFATLFPWVLSLNNDTWSTFFSWEYPNISMGLPWPSDLRLLPCITTHFRILRSRRRFDWHKNKSKAKALCIPSCNRQITHRVEPSLTPWCSDILTPAIPHPTKYLIHIQHLRMLFLE